MKKKLLVGSAVGGLTFAGLALAPIAQAQSSPTVNCWNTDGTFRVVSKGDSINEQKIRKGNYRIKATGVSCASASSMLHKWLETGQTDSPWFVAADNWGTMFTANQAADPSFVIKRVKKKKNPVGTTTVKCWKDHGTFRVVGKGAQIDGQKVRKGNYRIKATGISCGGASNYLHEWLASGNTTGRWFVAGDNWGTMFTKNQAANPSFVIKRV
jgi:hypothetical protein